MAASGKEWLAARLRAWPLLRILLRLAMRVLAPRQPVGAVGAVFNDAGQVLIVKHLFRTDFPWGLPGGWVERGENPSDTVKRELDEELHLQIEVKELLLSEQIPVLRTSAHPPHLGLAFYCRLVAGESSITTEVLAVDWCDPRQISYDMAPFQRRAVERGHEIFLRECRAPDERRVRTS